jgi:hypothetical protein
MSGTVIVYFEDEIKFASYDMNGPDVVSMAADRPVATG